MAVKRIAPQGALILAVGLLIAQVAPAGAASNIKPAAKAAVEEIRTWTLEPKIDLGCHTHFFLYPDGTPVEVLQGDYYEKRALATIKRDRSYTCFQVGNVYAKPENKGDKVWSEFAVKKNRIRIAFFRGGVEFNVLFDRPIVADDLAPQALAQALSGFFEISGPNLVSVVSVDARLAEAVGASAVEVAPTTAAGASRSGVSSLHAEVPTIAAVTVEASPARARRGEPVELILRYDVLGPTDDPVEVSQSWTLLLDGRPLPTYPTERRIARSPGAHEAALQQVIPNGAPAGLYKLKGEICVLEDCSTRTTTFEVLP